MCRLGTLNRGAYTSYLRCACSPTWIFVSVYKFTDVQPQHMCGSICIYQAPLQLLVVSCRRCLHLTYVRLYSCCLVVPVTSFGDAASPKLRLYELCVLASAYACCCIDPKPVVVLADIEGVMGVSGASEASAVFLTTYADAGQFIVIS